MKGAPQTSTLEGGNPSFPFPNTFLPQAVFPAGRAARDLVQVHSSSKVMCSAHSYLSSLVFSPPFPKKNDCIDHFFHHVFCFYDLERPIRISEVCIENTAEEGRSPSRRRVRKDPSKDYL